MKIQSAAFSIGFALLSTTLLNSQSFSAAAGLEQGDKPATQCRLVMTRGPQGSGKSTVAAALEALGKALDLPVKRTTRDFHAPLGGNPRYDNSLYQMSKAPGSLLIDDAVHSKHQSFRLEDILKRTKGSYIRTVLNFFPQANDEGKIHITEDQLRILQERIETRKDQHSFPPEAGKEAILQAALTYQTCAGQVQIDLKKPLLDKLQIAAEAVFTLDERAKLTLDHYRDALAHAELFKQTLGKIYIYANSEGISKDRLDVLPDYYGLTVSSLPEGLPIGNIPQTHLPLPSFHVTIQYSGNKSPLQNASIWNQLEGFFGQKVTGNITGMASDDNATAFIVSDLPKELTANNPQGFHITYALAPQQAAFVANKTIENARGQKTLVDINPPIPFEGILQPHFIVTSEEEAAKHADKKSKLAPKNL